MNVHSTQDCKPESSLVSLGIVSRTAKKVHESHVVFRCVVSEADFRKCSLACKCHEGISGLG